MTNRIRIGSGGRPAIGGGIALNIEVEGDRKDAAVVEADMKDGDAGVVDRNDGDVEVDGWEVDDLESIGDGRGSGETKEGVIRGVGYGAWYSGPTTKSTVPLVSSGR